MSKKRKIILGSVTSVLAIGAVAGVVAASVLITKKRKVESEVLKEKDKYKDAFLTANRLQAHISKEETKKELQAIIDDAKNKVEEKEKTEDISIDIYKEYAEKLNKGIEKADPELKSAKSEYKATFKNAEEFEKQIKENKLYVKGHEKLKAAIDISKNITKSNAVKELYIGVKKYLETILSEVKEQKAKIDKEIEEKNKKQ
ncbi:hypothetical protein MBVG596_0072 [Mycoplasmopsis bovigenitalium]|uniref:hypothetical protein n=1 Tax=Mycoplasmopsis bovigenitalium TaxID=2112 RepID=UPI0009096452|nr:hypothetical protein [Mycoplasmopsis bovigenitalium]BAW18019.1 hypothetical protein MBVG596_0072 [Mycoplasmopsis bovigenitalium]